MAMTLEEKIEAAVKSLQTTPYDPYWTVERAARLVANYNGPDGAEGERAAGFRSRFAERLLSMTAADLADWLAIATRHDLSREKHGGR